MGVIRLFLIAIQLISVFMYLKTIVSICKHFWQLFIRCGYKKFIARCCLDLSLDLSVKLLMKCVQCITDKMKCLRDNNANLQQQQEDTYGVISTPIQLQATDQ